MIELPFPPSRNHSHTRDQRPKAEYQQYMEAVGWILRASKVPKYENLRSISYFLYWPDKRRSDDDNRIKIVMDALVRGGLVQDDCWTCIQEKHFYNELDRDNPRIVVKWEEK